MRFVCLHDKAEIEAALRQDVPLHLYSLGDLDDFFWPYTQWYALKHQGQILAIALLYTAFSPPVLLALSPPEKIRDLRMLLQELVPLLPRRVYTHLSLGVEEVFDAYSQTSFGIHDKMVLKDRTQFQPFVSPQAVRLLPEHLPEIQALYRSSYAGNAFDPRMLETGQFFGLWEADRLVSVSGIHAYSPAFRVAAIGNVATHPDYRNRGFAKMVTAALCQSLLEKVDQIGLNVKADNAAAIQSYRRLGFEICASYHEVMLEMM